VFANTPSLAWFSLLLAGLLEIIWILVLKYSDGFTRFWPSIAVVAAIALSFMFLGFSLRSVPFGTAYAVWTGIGAAGAVAVGIILCGESADPARIACLVLIVVGTIGLRLVSPV
jgi:quaternary ammonium compound-resistance protein SugE